MSTVDDVPPRDILNLFVSLIQRIGEEVNGEQARIDSICEGLLHGPHNAGGISGTLLKQSPESDDGTAHPSTSHRRNKNPCKNCKKSRQKCERKDKATNTCERCILRALDCLSGDEDSIVTGNSRNATPSSQYAEKLASDAYATGALQSIDIGHYQMPYMMVQQIQDFNHLNASTHAYPGPDRNGPMATAGEYEDGYHQWPSYMSASGTPG